MWATPRASSCRGMVGMDLRQTIWSALSVLAVCLPSALSQGEPASKYFNLRSDRFYGDASNYGGPADGGWGAAMFGLTIGGCGYGDITAAWRYPRRAALAFDPTAPAIAGLRSFGCGTCWKITNPSGSWPAIVAMVTDICPECNAKHKTPNGVDIDFFTWTGLVDDKQYVGTIGLMPVVIEQVNCQPDASLLFQITDFTGGWNWLRIRPERVAGFGSIISMGLECPNVQLTSSTWSQLTNKWGTVYETPLVPLFAPGTGCRIWATVADGQVVASPWVDLNWYFGRGGTVDIGYNVDGVIYQSGLGGAPRWPYKEQFGRKLLHGAESPLNSSHIIRDEEGNLWRTKPYQPPDMPKELKDYLRQEGMLHVDDE